VPENNELARKFRDEGVVFIGVCHARGAEKMAESVKTHKIEYPVVADANGKTMGAYLVDGYPDYYIIDRDGTIVGADVGNDQVEAAIRAVLDASPSRASGPDGPKG
jgi:hypothetical protein